MKRINYIYFIICTFFLTSCITKKEVQYLQPNENLVINEEGLVPITMQEYRVTKNDIFNLNIVTTSQGDAAQFYSSLNTTTGTAGNTAMVGNTGSNAGASSRFYFTGIKVDSQGDIYIIGIGNIKAEGRTIESIRSEIQSKVNENFVKDKSEARLSLEGIRYYFLGDVETTGLTGEKVSYSQTLSLTEAIAKDGGLNRTVDRKNIVLQRRYPEGIKTVRLDLTREDIMNSPYYWLQNGDMIYLNTRRKSFNGFGKDPLQTITTGVTLLTTAMTIYLLFTRL